MKYNRTIKISDQADYALEAIKLLMVRKLKRRMTKGQIVQYALRTLADRIEETMEGDEDEKE